MLEVNTNNASDQKQLINKAKQDENVQRYLHGKTVRKEIFIPGKLINFVI